MQESPPPGKDDATGKTKILSIQSTAFGHEIAASQFASDWFHHLLSFHRCYETVSMMINMYMSYTVLHLCRHYGKSPFQIFG